MVSFISRPLYKRERAPVLNRLKARKTQNKSGCCEEEKKSLPCQESNLGHPINSMIQNMNLT